MFLVTDSNAVSVPLLAAGTDPPAASRADAAADSFRHLYQAHAAFVWRSLRRLGVPLDSVDDLAQEVFLIAFRRRGLFENRSTYQSWLYGIAFNLSRRLARKARRFPSEPVSESLADLRGASPQEALVRNEAVQTLYAVLDTLNPERRAVFVMTELEQMSAPEIAKLTGAPLNTVYTRLRAARRDFEVGLKRIEAREGRRQQP